MGIVIALGLSYFPGMLIVLRLIAHAQKKLLIDRRLKNMPKGKAATANLPKPIWPTWRERLAFTLKDTRPSKAGMPNRTLFFVILGLGLALALIAGLTGAFTALPLGYILFFTAVIYSNVTAKPIIDTRKAVITRMYEVGKSKGVVSTEYSDNPAAAVKVLSWVDFVKPTRVEMQVRTEFSNVGEEGFLQQFNQVFGSETAWVPSDDPETNAPGWNYEEGKVTLHSVPPLPQMAKWDETYVLDPGIAWSFFPIALGIENGIERKHPKTGETEWILGFDVSGEASKIGSAAGYKVAPSITTSPMCFSGDTFVALADGTFKSFDELADIDSPVEVFTLDANGVQTTGLLRNCMVLKETASVFELSFSDGTSVKCTDEHKFRLKAGGYKSAYALSATDLIEGFGQEPVYATGLKYIKTDKVYCGEVDKTHNFAVITDKGKMTGVYTKNCLIGGGTGGGKSLATDTIVEVLEEQQAK
jgi:hypothetical protein